MNYLLFKTFCFLGFCAKPKLLHIFVEKISDARIQVKAIF